MVIRKEHAYYKAIRRVIAVINSNALLKQIFDTIVRNIGRSMLYFNNAYLRKNPVLDPI